MINPSNILTVLTYDGTDYSNVTAAASDPSLDIFRHAIGPTKYIYIGYNKPITALYVQMSETVNVDGGNMTAEYFNGTSWTNLQFIDQTQYFLRSSIINWTLPDNFTETEVNGITKCWVRLSGDSETADLDFSYMGLVFSDDSDIKTEFPSILQNCYYPSGQSSFIGYHVNSKEYIMNELLRRGYTKTVGTNKEPINQWDVLDIYELRQASLYYAMSQIFFNLSDNSSDNYWQKYTEYKNKYEQAMSLGMLRIDQDNDGKIDESEKLPIASYRWVR